MKRMIPLLCALAMLLVGCVPVFAASEDRPYYPVAVEESFEGGVDDYRIRKVYQLSLSDDPANIPVQDFERNGYTFHLLDMTRKDDVGIDTMPWVETVTKASDTNDLERILQMLDAEIEVTTEEGYAGTLRLDHTSVQVSVDGYATKTRTLSATRTYPNLSDADVSLVPKTITDGGNTLELDDVQWTESLQRKAITMKNSREIALVAAGIMLGATLAGPATQAAEMVAAQRSAQRIYVDGQQVQMEAYAIGGANYVKLRDVGKAVGFNVSWDAGTGSVQISSDEPYAEDAARQTANGRIVTLPTDGSKYTPRVGDLIPCDDGTLYEVKNTDRFENNVLCPLRYILPMGIG